MPYMNVTEVESALIALANAYPAICELITLPYASAEGKSIHAVRIGAFGAMDRSSVLITGAVHAREWGGSEICVNVAADLCEAYTSGTGLGYGGKHFNVAQVKAIVEGLNLIVLADVNPDGRDFSQTTDALWRRNRNTAESGGNPDCIGVDLNRNQDFLWDFPAFFDPASGVNTSDSPCSPSQTYRGSAVTSEPETKNVVWLMDTFTNIRWYLDLHSHGQDILHSWGDDENQSSDAAQNFMNAAFNGQRGVSGDGYREFIPGSELSEIISLGDAFHDCLLAVRGKNYTVAPAYALYPTSGANDDYAYSRHFTNPALSNIFSYTIEFGTEFHPAWAEMEFVIADVTAGILGFCLQAICGAPSVNLDTPSVTFNDVPELETTARAVVFTVIGCQAATFQIVAGPTVTSGPGGFGTLPSSTSALGSTATIETRQARLWLSFTGTNAGDIATGEVTVRHVESGQQWVIPISANTIERPTVAVALAFDQSGSMLDPSGLSGFATRGDVLKFSAPVFVNVIQEQNGIGIVSFDQNAYVNMPVATAGPPTAFDPTRATALGAIAAYAPNPSGLTAIGDAVEAAHNILMPATSFDQRAMIVFTDGHETEAKYIADVASLINDRVFAIGLGTADQIQPSALTALTNGSGGYLLLTGAIGPEDLFLLSKYYLQILAGATNMDVVLDPEGSIKPGQKHRIPFHLNEADIAANVILLGATNLPIIRFALETPDGQLIDAGVASSTAGIDYIHAQGVNYYRMTLPVPIGPSGARSGKWHAVLTVDERYYKRYLASLDNYPELYQQVLAHGVSYSLSVHSYSGIRLQGQILQTSLQPGATMTVRGVLTEYGLPVPGTRAQVRVEFERPDGTSGVLAMPEETPGSGIYTVSIPAPLVGVYRFRMLATGQSLRARPFEREHLLTGAVWQGGDNPPPNSAHDPGLDHERLCRLLSCLFGENVFTPVFETHLQELGLDIRAFRACLKRWCAERPRPGVLTPATVRPPLISASPVVADFGNVAEVQLPASAVDLIRQLARQLDQD